MPHPNDPFGLGHKRKRRDEDRRFYYDINTNSKLQRQKDSNMFSTTNLGKYAEGMIRSQSSWSDQVHNSKNYLS
jgi:hypothetical protein